MVESPEKTARCFIDTNIWLYALIETGDAHKHRIARTTVSNQPAVISTQIVNETCVNMLQKAQMSETQVRALIAAFYSKYEVRPLDYEAIQRASELRERYSLSYWDSIVVASALTANCAILYSEDMQDGLCIDDQLTLVNPFRT